MPKYFAEDTFSKTWSYRLRPWHYKSLQIRVPPKDTQSVSKMMQNTGASTKVHQRRFLLPYCSRFILPICSPPTSATSAASLDDFKIHTSAGISRTCCEQHDFKVLFYLVVLSKIVSEYDQEIPQSQTADSPVAPRGRAAQPSRDTRKTN